MVRAAGEAVRAHEGLVHGGLAVVVVVVGVVLVVVVQSIQRHAAAHRVADAVVVGRQVVVGGDAFDAFRCDVAFQCFVAFRRRRRRRLVRTTELFVNFSGQRVILDVLHHFSTLAAETKIQFS